MIGNRIVAGANLEGLAEWHGGLPWRVVVQRSSELEGSSLWIVNKIPPRSESN